MKKIRKVLTLFCMFAILLSLNVNTAKVYAASAVSRGEWIRTLVTTFDMKVEDGLLPDIYYGDIEESSYYKDILLAINFGVIDLEAGEDFRPNDGVTREFAAQTLNYCLGYELDEESSFTMDDVDDLQYPKDDQIAVNLGWLTLKNGDFLPEQDITTAEKTAMIAYAQKVIDEAKVDANHKNIYEFEKGIVEVPRGTIVEWNEDGQVVIYDSDVSIEVGNRFAVYVNGIAYTYKATEVKSASDCMVITTQELSYDDVVSNVDAEGVVEVDLGDFIPASDDIFVEAEYADATDDDILGAPLGRGSKRIKDLKVSKKVGAGTAECKITNLNVNYIIQNGRYLFSVDGTATASYTLSGKCSKSVPLGSWPVNGIGTITATLNLSASGSATVSFSSNFQCGVEYSKSTGVRKIMNFTAPSWHFSAKAELKAGCNIAYIIEVPCVASGKVYAEIGVKSTPDMEVYSDGKKPTCCVDLPVWLYAVTGYSVKIMGADIINETINIFSEGNSPIKGCYHIEDGHCVPACTRGDSPSRVGKRKYYTTGALGGSYSGNAFVAPWAAEAEPTFEYKLDDDGNATITKYRGNVYALTIPDELDGHPVVGIARDVFRKNTALHTVVIPDSIITLAGGVFAECVNLQKVELSKNLEEMGGLDFYDCDKLTSIEIPKSLLSTNSVNAGVYLNASGYGPFYGCDGLKNVTFEKGIVRIARGLFSHCSGMEKIVIPDTVTLMDEQAFSYCENLTDVKIGNAVTQIGNDAFRCNKSLASIIIPDSVVKMGTAVFAECENLQSVKLSKQLETIGVFAFYDCDKLSSIEIPKSLLNTTKGYYNEYHYGYIFGPFYGCDGLKNVTFEKGTSRIVNGLFAYCSGLEKIVIPDTVTLIDDGAFSYCENLTDVKIGNAVTQIGNDAFRCNKSLASIIIPDSVVKMGTAVFAECENLQSVKLSKQLETIGVFAFYDCDKLSSIEIPKSLLNTTKGYYNEYHYGYIFGPFYGCDGLKNVTFEKGTEQIVNDLFAYCSGLEKIVIPDTVMSIDDGAFSYCENLSDVTIPDSVTGFGDKVFIQNKSLKSIVIPDSVIGMGTSLFEECTSLEKVHIPNVRVNITDRTFYNCKSLKEVNFPDTLRTIGKTAFYQCLELQDVKLPEGLTAIYEGGFFGCVSIVNLTIPSGVKEIGNQAFDYCQSLESVTLPDTLQSMGKYAFAHCDKLAEVRFGAGIRTIPEYCFYEDPVLQEVLLPYQVTSVGQYAFANCTAFNKITMNRNVSSIGANVFSYPDKLTIYGVTGTYAEDYAKENSIKFVALNTPAQAVHLSKNVCRLGRGRELQLTATITPENSSDEMTWTSTDSEVVQVDENGLIEGISLGKASVVVMMGSKTDVCEVTVYEPVYSVWLNTNSATLSVGETIQLEAEINPENADNKNVSWESSNEKVATVKDGLVTAISNGTADITVITEDGEITNTCVVTVQPTEVTGITLDKKSLSMEVGETATLTYTITPENASNQEVTWSSSKESVATVENGEITAVSNGTAIIIVKTVNGSKTASCVVTVGDGIGDDPGEDKPGDDNPGEETPQEDFTYTINDDETVTITKYIGTGKTVVVPATIDGYTVTVIGEEAFKDCTSITSLTLPDTIKEIGDYAFSGCTNMKTFKGMTDNLESLGFYAFSNCSSLTTIELNAGRKNIVEGLFSGCTSLSSVKLPDSVQTIQSNAFEGCKSLKEISLPASLEKIESNAFANSGVTTIKYAGTESQWKSVTVASQGNGPISEAKKTDGNGTIFDKGKEEKEEDEKDYTPRTPSLSGIANKDGGVNLSWSTSWDSDGYYIYRSTNGGSYKKIKTLAWHTTSFTDTTVSNGKKYQYKLEAYASKNSQTYVSAQSSAKGICYLSKTSISSVKSKATKKMTVKWKKNSKATGYEIQYSLKSNFSGKKTVKVKGASKINTTIKNLKKGKTYYVRVRVYKTSGGKKYTSVWSGKKKVKVK